MMKVGTACAQLSCRTKRRFEFGDAVETPVPDVTPRADNVGIDIDRNDIRAHDCDHCHRVVPRAAGEVATTAEPWHAWHECSEELTAQPR